MKDFLSQTFYHNTIQQWLYSMLFVIGGIVLSKAIYWVFKTVIKTAVARTKTTFDDVLIVVIEKPILYTIVISGAWLGFERLHFTDTIDKFMSHGFKFALILNITWLLTRAVGAFISEVLLPISERSDNSLDNHIIPVLNKGVKGALWTVGIIVGLDNAGFDIMALVAGLGIGGLALALAAQDTVKNIFGGLIIFIDKPFKIGERVQVSGHDGVVQEVGIRSTRIRTLEGRLVTIPNSKFSESSIENVTAEPTRRVKLELGLTYQTTPQQMDLAMSILKDIIDKNQEHITEEHLISFNNWGDFNLGVLFIYYIRKEADIFQTQSTINLQILKRFNENGLDFAYPTQTIYKKELQ
jgi:MscS family membrane protein